MVGKHLILTIVGAGAFAVGAPAHLLDVAGSSPSATAEAADTPCAQTDVVFYTTDTIRLATELGRLPSACADYHLSVTPGGLRGELPRGGGPITAIRSLGSRFHALAEVRPHAWSDYAAVHGWYAAGVEVRRLMAAVGYNVALGDSWAINEVGAPSTSSLSVEVLRDVGTAREDLLEFLRGLYTGAGSPSRGLVFAANPAQVAGDVSQYKQELLSWYADTPFWDELAQYVRFWAQETYADARTTLVAGATLDERSAALKDYFQHGHRLAAAASPATASAAGFFDAAYAPLANAAFRWPGPNPDTGIGFGYTDLSLATMQNFVSTQTYAQRAAGARRLGFAFVPRQNSATAAEWVALAARLAASVQGSQAEASGACGAAMTWCDGVVDGAQLNDTWTGFADVTPPIVTPRVTGPLGENGWYVGDVTVGWDITDPGSAVLGTSGCDDATVTEDSTGTTFTCAATSRGGTGSASVTIRRDATPPVLQCSATSDTLWPPNGKLVPIEVGVELADATSGAAGFALVAATGGDTADDVADFVLDTPDVDGRVRATRLGSETARIYALEYAGRDSAGNGATCTAHVVVPHDQRSG